MVYKLYRVEPQGADAVAHTPLPKRLLTSWRTKLTVFDRSFANYEGMCLGPTLTDGSRVLLIVADSHDQYAGVLKDWITSVKLITPPDPSAPPVQERRGW